jgi:hypothetical protein
MPGFENLSQLLRDTQPTASRSSATGFEHFNLTPYFATITNLE